MAGRPCRRTRSRCPASSTCLSSATAKRPCRRFARRRLAGASGRRRRSPGSGGRVGPPVPHGLRAADLQSDVQRSRPATASAADLPGRAGADPAGRGPRPGRPGVAHLADRAERGASTIASPSRSCGAVPGGAVSARAAPPSVRFASAEWRRSFRAAVKSIPYHGQQRESRSCRYPPATIRTSRS